MLVIPLLRGLARTLGISWWKRFRSVRLRIVGGYVFYPSTYYFSFPCSIGLDFSFVRKESNLRVNGSFHGCVDFPLVARVIFMSFLSYFCWIFVHGLFLRIGGVWVRICWWVSWIIASCIFVLDHDPSNSQHRLRFHGLGFVDQPRNPVVF
jgi:hypothetical protein